jgi:copper resistance protein C
MKRPATRSPRLRRVSRPVRARGGLALAAIAGVVIAVVLPATAAQAHSVLLATAPAAGASVATKISEVTLTFNERVHGDFSTVVVKGLSSRGAIVSYSDGRVQVIDDVVHQKVYPLRSGSYDVAWRVISADGHPVEGQFDFTVRLSAGQEPAADPPPPATTANSGSSSSGHDAAWIAGGAAALVVAAALVAWALWPRRRAAARSTAVLDDIDPDESGVGPELDGPTRT